MIKAGTNSYAILSVIASLWCPLLFGLSIGYTGPTGATMLAPSAGNKLYILESETMKSLFGSLLLVGCAFGSLLAGHMVQKLGRRLTLLATSPVYTLSFICMAMTTQQGFLLFGRFASGLAVGVCSVATPMYIAEIAPDSLRGALGALNQLLIVIGIAVAYFLGLLCANGKHASVEGPLTNTVDWRLFTWFYVGPSIMILLSMWAAPESPRYLAGVGKLQSAITTLTKLRGGDPSAQEVSALETLAINQEDLQLESSTMADLKACKSQLIVGITLHVLQQFSGINAVMFYMPDMFKDAGHDASGLMWSSMTALLQIAVTGVACVCMDMVGRRTLLIVASSGLAGSLIVMGGAIQAKEFLKASGLDFLFIVAIFAYITFFSIGVGAIPWLILAEIFPDKVRASASSIASMVNWSCAVLITQLMDTMQKAFGSAGLMWFYSVFCVFLVAFTFFCVPETKGKTFEEIQAHFEGAPLVKGFSGAVTSPGSEAGEEKI